MRGRVWLNHERVRWGCRQGAMQCGREIVVSPLSLSRTPLGVEPTSTAHRSLPSRFEGTGLASYGERARQYYQADHKAPIACRLKNTMDRDGIRQTHKRSRSVFTHLSTRPTTTTGQTPRCCHADRVTPARAAPPRTCEARAAGTGNTPPALCDVGGRCLALGVCSCTGRWFPFFILQSQHKK